MIIKNLKKVKNDIVCPPKVGEIVEGVIVDRGRSALFIDLGCLGVGVIYGKEFFQAKDMLKEFKIGDKVFTKVTGLETDEGYRELSFIEANQEMAWKELADAKEAGDSLEVQIKGANKGGLICQIKGIQAFLPASQLLPEHYPKVKGADPSKIAQELQKLVGQKIKVKIFDVNAKEQKLILSEKATRQEKLAEELKDYQVGDTVEGEISGITNFGAFIKFGESLEGLIHSSEISSEEKNPADLLKVGEKIQAKIINIANNRIYLSLK